MRRSEELIECLGKKELYEKLDSKKPKNTEEDEMLKHQASQSLTALLKKLLGKWSTLPLPLFYYFAL